MRPLIATLLAVSTLLTCSLTSANARVRTDGGLQPAYDRHDLNPFRYAPDVVKPTHRIARKFQNKKKTASHRGKKVRYASARGSNAEIVAHPAGCPARSFCGCGVSLHVFGKVVREGGLAIAAEWLRFPRTAPAPGMVAARRGHVFAILKVISPGRVLAYDPNSGRHQTRIWERSIAGFTIVNPHGA